MWIDSKFLYKLNTTLEDSVNGENIDIEQRFQNYNSPKYLQLINILKRVNKKIVSDSAFTDDILNKIDLLSKGNFSKFEEVNNDKFSKLFSNLNKFIKDLNKINASLV